MQEILLVSQRETDVLWKIPGGKEGIMGNLHHTGRSGLNQTRERGCRVIPSHSRSFLGHVSVGEWAFQMKFGRGSSS